MKHFHKYVTGVISVCMALTLIFGVLSAGMRAEAKTSAAKVPIRDVVTEAVGTNGDVRAESKDRVIDRFALNASMVKATSAGWNDSNCTAVVIVQCKKASQAKKVQKKFAAYLKNIKEDSARYGSSANEHINAARTGRTGKYAILVMLSTDADKNSKGVKAAIKKLEK